MSPRIARLFVPTWLCAVAGCSANVTTAPANNTPVEVPAGCQNDSSLSCAAGTGWTCAAGDNPENEQSNLSCSIPTADGPNDDFCCFEWTYGSSCTPDDALTSVCQPGSYGYRCQAGDNPASLDSSLNCSSPTPDGSDDDFCCQ